MKTLGLIGGMSWESSAEYYRIINQGVRDQLGPKASAQLVLWSFDFAEIAALLHVVEDTVFDVYVFRSYAHYAWDFLCATAKESARVKLFGAQDVPA